jgi:hypothetical protein
MSVVREVHCVSLVGKLVKSESVSADSSLVSLVGSVSFTESVLLKVPSLVEAVVAIPPGDWLLISVLNSPDIKA